MPEQASLAFAAVGGAARHALGALRRAARAASRRPEALLGAALLAGVGLMVLHWM